MDHIFLAFVYEIPSAARIKDSVDSKLQITNWTVGVCVNECVFVKWHKNNADIFGHKYTCIQKLTSIAEFHCDSLDASFIRERGKKTKMNNDDGLNFKKSPQKYPMLLCSTTTHSETVCSKYRRYIYTHSSTRFDSAKHSTIILNCHRVMAHMLCFAHVCVCVCVD